MHIDQQKCVACGNCVAVCPMGAISIDSAKNRAVVNADECVECYTCFRGMSMEHLNPTMVRGIRRLLKVFRLRFDPEPDVCPTSAIIPDELSWPRVVRRAFSGFGASAVSQDMLNMVQRWEVPMHATVLSFSTRKQQTGQWPKKHGKFGEPSRAIIHAHPRGRILSR